MLPVEVVYRGVMRGFRCYFSLAFTRPLDGLTLASGVNELKHLADAKELARQNFNEK